MDSFVTLLQDNFARFVTAVRAHYLNVVLGVLTLVAIVLLGRLLDRLLRPTFARARVRPAKAQLIRKLVTALAWAVAIVAAAIVMFPTITPGRVLTALGFTSIAIGFAFKDIIENFFAGILILAREPFSIGDVIECDGKEGLVESISLRYTYMRQVDGQQVVLPNGTIFKEPVTVRTDWPSRRVLFVVGIGYGADLDGAREVIRQAVLSCPSVHANRPVEVFTLNLSPSTVDIEVAWWTGSKPLEVRRSRDEVVTAVKKALDAAGIEIPFPHTALLFPEALRLTREPPE